MELSTEHARSFFSAQGFVVQDIPTAGDQQQKRADLRAIHGSEEYIVEAKAREPDREWYATMERADRDGAASSSRQIQPWWTLSKRISEAREQLVATPASPGAFRVLWVVALHGDARFVISCYEKQLAGVRQLMVFRPEHFAEGLAEAVQPMRCYFFEDNEFERYPEIDAAMLCTPDGGQLFVNHFSPNRDRFRRSHLYSVVNEYGAAIDAEDLTVAGRALMLDKDFRGPRGAGAQQRYLQAKYGVGVSIVHESQFHGVAVLPLTATEPAQDAAGEGADVVARRPDEG